MCGWRTRLRAGRRQSRGAGDTRVLMVKSFLFMIIALCCIPQAADQIAVLDAGKVVELGTHDELIEQGGYYKRLISSQSLSLSR